MQMIEYVGLGIVIILAALARKYGWWGRARKVWGKTEVETGENTLLVSETDKILHDYILSMEPSSESGVTMVDLENQGMTKMDSTALIPLHNTSFLTGSDMRILKYDPDNNSGSLEIITRRKNIELVQENNYLLGELDRLRERHKEKTEEDTELQKQTTMRVYNVGGKRIPTLEE